MGFFPLVVFPLVAVPVPSAGLAERLVQPVQLVRALLVVEAVVPYHDKSLFRNVHEDIHAKLERVLVHVLPPPVAVVVVVPVDGSLLLVEFEDPSFRDRRPWALADDVLDAPGRAFVPFAVFPVAPLFLLRAGVLRLDVRVVGCADVVAVAVLFVCWVVLAEAGDHLPVARHRYWAEAVQEQLVELPLPLVPEHVEVDVVEVPVGAVRLVPCLLRDDGMDVGVPFQVPAKGVQACDHSRDKHVLVAVEKVDAAVCLADAFPRLPRLFKELVVFLGVGDDEDGVSCGDVEQVQERPVVPGQNPVFLGDREDDVPVRPVDACRGCRCGDDPLRLCAARWAEAAVAGAVELRDPMAARALEDMCAKEAVVAEDRFIDRIVCGFPDLLLGVEPRDLREVGEEDLRQPGSVGFFVVPRVGGEGLRLLDKPIADVFKNECHVKSPFRGCATRRKVVSLPCNERDAFLLGAAQAYSSMKRLFCLGCFEGFGV